MYSTVLCYGSEVSCYRTLPQQKSSESSEAQTLGHKSHTLPENSAGNSLTNGIISTESPQI